MRGRHGAEVPPSFSLRLARERHARGWSYAQLAIAARISHTAVRRAESGADICLSSAVAIARALGLSLDEMTGVSGNGKTISEEGTT